MTYINVGDGIRIPQLEGDEQFDYWQAKVRMGLALQGLGGFITGTETRPVDNNPPADNDEIDDFTYRKYLAWRLLRDSIASWKKDHYVEGFDIPRHLYKDERDFIDKVDPKLLWDSVERQFLDVDGLQKNSYLRELACIDQSQFDNISALLSRALWLRNRLERLDMPVSEEMMRTCVFAGVRRHPSERLKMFLDLNYHKLTSESMMDWIWQNESTIDGEAKQHREQQEANRRRNANGQSSGHRGGSRQRGRGRRN